MGEEHPEHDAIQALFEGKKIPRPVDQLLDDHGTPNQRMMAAALRLGWERRYGTPAGLMEGIAQTTAMLILQEKWGHQAVGPGGGEGEAGAPDPHADIWCTGAYFALHEALNLPRSQGANLVALGSRWLRNDCGLSAAFANADGMIAQPCTRARFLAQGPPWWGVRSQTYQMARGQKLLGPPYLRQGLPLDLLRAVLSLKTDLLITDDPPAPKLPFPIRRWNMPDGGFVAWMAPVEGMNDPFCWVVVDHDWKVVQFPLDAGVPFPVELVAGLASYDIGGIVSGAPEAAGGPITVPDPTPPPPSDLGPVAPKSQLPTKKENHWTNWL